MGTRDDYRKTIVVAVGTEQEPLVLHQMAACKHSIYFRTACGASTGNITLSLPTVDPKTFLSFVEFSCKATTAAGSDGLDTSTNYTEIIELYALAHRLGSVSLRKHCIDKVIRNYAASDDPPDVKHIAMAWKLVAGDSMLKRLLADLWAATATAEAIMAAHEDLPREFVAMMFVRKGIKEPTVDSIL